ncbi:MAG: hypothetical protein JST84_26020 [Acidobacteria bacterium]|nr:hypothetical protein [Acidobacteriota bacterium]
MKRRLICIPILFLLISVGLATGQSVKTDKFKSSFRYIIVSNFARNGQDDIYKYRIIQVLINETDFNAETLTQLNELVSKRYPSPENLHISVATNLDQLMTPEEVDLYGGREGYSPISSDHQEAYIQNTATKVKITIRRTYLGEIVRVIEWEKNRKQ